MFKQVYAGEEVLLQFDFVSGGQTVLVTNPQVDVFDPYGSKVKTQNLVFVGGHYITYYSTPTATLGSYLAVAKGEYNYEGIIANSQVRFDVVASLSVELVTLAEAKEYLGLEDFSEDSLIRALVLSSSEAILKYTQMKLGNHTETERRQLVEAMQFELRYFPVTAITSITLDDAELEEDTEYYFESSTGIIKFFDPVSGFFECTYTFGLTQIPQPVKLACLKLVSVLYNLRESEGFSSRRLLSNVENYLRDTKMDVMFEVRSLLAPYCRKLV